MGKGQRFTPALLARWEENGRGEGLKANYQPWHQVTRTDPGSRGRSWIIPSWLGRVHHLLSDVELVAFAFANMCPDVEDIREQYPLQLDTHGGELRRVSASVGERAAPGTLGVASDLGVRYPHVTSPEGLKAPWRMSTDLLLTLRRGGEPRRLLAVSVKPTRILKRRVHKLLRVEREYWLRQDCTWLLLTSELYHPQVATTLRSSLGWGLLADRASPEHIEAVADMHRSARLFEGQSIGRNLTVVQQHLQLGLQQAQEAFWQAVWCGALPLDLTVPLRAELGMRFLSADEFMAHNPIACRRTSWFN